MSSILLIIFCVASSLLVWGGAVELMVGSHWIGVDLRQPLIVLIDSRSLTSTSLVSGLLRNIQLHRNTGQELTFAEQVVRRPMLFLRAFCGCSFFSQSCWRIDPDMW
ncbi:hypothetical protein ElyMa_002194000 [Elysia marginata]|uniref:Secreted protein n=1 Tax=Elysia marginata TaxID=1093978 RepID=A0AAV4FQT2_9GAST|nr:hypothetical protein ElyMa_002194000 [Elysia marginata]